VGANRCHDEGYDGEVLVVCDRSLFVCLSLGCTPTPITAGSTMDDYADICHRFRIVGTTYLKAAVPRTKT